MLLLYRKSYILHIYIKYFKYINGNQARDRLKWCLAISRQANDDDNI